MGTSSSKQGPRRLQKRVPASELKPGDLVLVRERVITEFGMLDPGVVRGILSTQTENYFTVQEQALPGWTHAGIVVKYRGAEPALLVEATLEGIEAFPLPARIRHYQTIGAEVAARQLTAPMNTATEATLQSLVSAALSGCMWSTFFPSESAGKQKATRRAAAIASSRDAAGGRGLLDGPGDEPVMSWARAFVGRLIARVWASVSRVPQQVELELCRAFATYDKDGSGAIDLSEVRAVLEDLRGSRVSSKEAKQVMTAMDTNDDGVVTLDEFVACLARRPLRKIPVEHDVAMILSGEFIASVYEDLGLLVSREPPKRNEAAHAAASAAAGGAIVRAAALKAGGESVRVLKARTETEIEAAQRKGISSFPHFTPMHFASIHDPPLRLLRGKLEREVLIDAAKPGQQAAERRGCCSSRAPGRAISHSPKRTPRTSGAKPARIDIGE